jgi:hypothetical protein
MTSRTRFALPLLLAVLVALLSAAACGSGDDTTAGTATGATGPGGGGSGPGGGGSGPGGGGGATACEPNQTQPCDCPEGVGSERCAPDGSGWSACECTTYGAEIAVSPDGNDSNPGTLASPFLTLGRAQQAVRDLVTAGLPAGGVVVWLRGGVYPLSEPLALGPEDSGSAGSPVAWRGYPGEQARVLGGVTLPPASFTPVTSASPIYGRLDPEAQAAVLEISLPDQGISDYGDLVRRGFCAWVGQGPLELFVDGTAMTLARWPDAADNNLPTDLETADALDLFGTVSPDVTGHYVKDSVQDGVSSFSRQGLVGGLQYHLYRYTWVYQNTTEIAWFLTTDASGYPTDTNPWWYRYDSFLGPMDPGTGATGQVTTHDPAVINHGFATIAEALSDTQWRYTGDRPSRWAAASDIWFHGFWKYSWADCHVSDATIDTATKTVTFAEVPGYGIVTGQPYYAYNIPEELTVPGEYWIDRSDGTLYLWPPAGFAQAEVVVSMVASPLVGMTDASYVELRDFTLEAGRSDLVQIDGGSNDALVGLTLRNAGTNAGSITGTDHLVRSCHVYGTGSGGFRVDGGDRPSLAPGGISVENSSFHHMSRWDWTYRPAVLLSGSGNSVSHNSIHDLPHTAILFSGNEHQIELNLIHHVLQFSSDAGAIYTGRDWGFRGNVVKNNFIHHISTWFEGWGVQGIYLDDCVSGIRVEGNILYAIAGHGLQHGGGRDDLMLNNIVARSNSLLTADKRCVDWPNFPNNIPGDDGNLLEKLENVGYQNEPWASTYPECAAIPDDWAIVSDLANGWRYPQGCMLSRNIGFGNLGWIDQSDGTLDSYADTSNNLQEIDPLFVDEANLNLNLQPNSPAHSIPGWEDIPFDSIGIQP